MQDQIESEYGSLHSFSCRGVCQLRLPQWPVLKDNAMCAVVLQPPTLATSAHFIEKDTGVDGAVENRFSCDTTRGA
jgi:hypothetical protein